VLRAEAAGNLELPNVGKVRLRGIVGNPVSADLVKLNVSLVETENDNGYIDIICAVRTEANDDLVLAANVVDSLMQRQSQVDLV